MGIWLNQSQSNNSIIAKCPKKTKSIPDDGGTFVERKQNCVCQKAKKKKEIAKSGQRRR